MLKLILLLLPSLVYADSFGVKESTYSTLVKKIESSWPIKGLSTLGEQEESLKFEAIQNEASPFSIGAIQMMTIKAPLSQVAQVVDQFSEYTKIFDGLRKSEVKDRKTTSEGELVRIFFEESVPVPFVPNDRSEVIYQIRNLGIARKIYRYQLHEGNHLISSDGMIILDAISADRTRYVEIDFFSAEWGLAKALGQKKIWIDSLNGLIQPDFAFKVKIENPTWSNEQVLKESVKLTKNYPTEKKYLSRTEEKLWLKQHEL